MGRRHAFRPRQVSAGMMSEGVSVADDVTVIKRRFDYDGKGLRSMSLINLIFICSKKGKSQKK